jgi:uncharacterized protein
MKNKVILMAGIVTILLLASLAGCTSSKIAPAASDGSSVVNVNSQQGIWVSGVGKVTVTPDIANISLGVSAQAVKVTDAQAQASASMDKVMAALAAAGIDKKDIQTQYFNINPTYRYDNVTGQSTITGYQVSNQVTVKIRAVEKTGTVIDSVSAAAGDNTRVNGVSFSVDQPDKHNIQARTLAMNDAKARAQALAGLAGVNLGQAFYITESSASQPIAYPVAMKADAAGGVASSTAISPGQTDLVLNVQVAYNIR